MYLKPEDLRNAQRGLEKEAAEVAEHLHQPDDHQRKLHPFEEKSCNFKAADQVDGRPGARYNRING
ncbi:hypothetical protein D3C80_1986980 [compost metagenome]